MQFPKVSGSNLEGRRYRLPGDLEGERNLLFIPFQRWHQDWVDTWVPFARELQAEIEGLRYYELPTLPRMNPVYRMSLDLGMKMGIPDRAAREATITLYLDKDAYRQALQIPSEDTIVVLLIDRTGAVLWRTEGPFDDTKAAELRALLSSHQTI
ncbi:MAG: hypothetical protein U0X20_28075 [Caldilineaceae bacterium]